MRQKLMSNYSQIQAQKVSSILVQCFIDDPSFDFILGDYGNKIDVLNAFFQLFVADAM
jgi:hypothetical protein